jgi:hypothetical protein
MFRTMKTDFHVFVNIRNMNKSKIVLQFARLFVYHEDSPDSPHDI